MPEKSKKLFTSGMYDVGRLERETLTRGWSINQLSDVARVDHHTIYKLFAGGRCRPTTVRKVAEALGVSRETIILAEGPIPALPVMTGTGGVA